MQLNSETREGTKEMSRIITIDEDTAIGYTYLTDKFYIINKGTYTLRSTAQLAKQVLNIVAPSNTVTLEDLSNLKSTNEVLTELYYTLHDSGSYVSSIQINDYTANPLVLDCNRQVLYIKSTDLVFNLTLNEARESRIQLLKDYYLDTFGISLTMEELTLMYNYLISMYIPYVYNVITDTSTDPVLYSNIFAISNWNNKSKAVYNCTLNPNNTYTKEKIGDIIEAAPSTDTLYILNYTGTLNNGDTIYVEGTTTETQTYTYTADGEYEVASVQANENNITEIKVITALSSSYTFQYPKAYVQLATTSIVSIDREAGTITLSSDVSDLISDGDVVEVTNTQQEIEGTTVSCNGTYIVASIQDNIITVQGTLPTNYTYTDQEIQGVLSKNMFIGNVGSVVSNTDSEVLTTITLMQDALIVLSPLQHVFTQLSTGERTYFTIQTVTSQQEFTCITASYTGTEPLHTYTPVYPELQTRKPDTDILVEVTSTDNENVFPTGKFMVDNFEQCREYINLYSGLAVPPYSVYNNIGKEVGGDIEITGTGVLPVCRYLGLYSQVYEEE